MSPLTAGEATVICVLGMSRTGTSLTTRVLNLLGVYLGEDEELLGGDLRQLAGEGEAVVARARETNPEGFWEHYRIMRLNERILRALGGSWREPPSLQAGWEASSTLEAEREEARLLLEGSFAGRPLWGWKDPRNALTLPFWQQLLPQMRYVICLRNPLDVASSLQRRDGMSLAEGIDLWQAYVTSALANTSGGPRLFVPYERHFEEPWKIAEQLARFVGREDALDDVEIRRRITEAVDERLWRHRTTPREAIEDERVPATARALHSLTESLASEVS